MCTIGKPRSRKASTSRRIAGSAAEVPGISSGWPSSTSVCASIVIRAALSSSGSVYVEVGALTMLGVARAWAACRGGARARGPLPPPGGGLEGSGALDRVGHVGAEPGAEDADRRTHRLVLGLAQVDRDPRGERAIG